VLLAASFLERNSWLPGVVVAIVLFIIGTSVTLYLRRRDKDSKHLDYRIVSDIQIVRSHNRPETLKVVYGPLEVRNPFITEVKFKNTGKQVIEPEDFLAPVTILRPNAKVLDFNVVDESEKDLIDHISQIVDPPNEENPVEVVPKTLNHGDWFTVQLIYDVRKHENVTAAGRIRGQTRQSQVYQEREPITRAGKKMIAGLALCALLTFALLIGINYTALGSQYIGLISSLAAVAGLFSGVIFGYVLPRGEFDLEGNC
jgi:hypothetical protein